MSEVTAIALWRELRTLLQSRGELPFQHEVMTPSEIADAVHRAGGDRRTRRFIWDYYYPQRYGSSADALTDTDAATLVQSLRTTPEPAASDTADEPAVDRCGICHVRPARGGS